jgi:peptide/nickel transport system substrate-binding protein
VIDQWVAGDHISLSRNENYFRASEGLPLFDRLVFRFVADGAEALAALQAGECDFVDETVPLVDEQAGIAQLQDEGQLTMAFETGTAWEHADFGILPSDPERPSFFQDVRVRQAIVMCIDRESMVERLFSGRSSLLESYAPPAHPLSNPEARLPEYDPQAAADLLQEIGWIETGDPDTTRVANGIPGIEDGTLLAIPYIYVSGSERDLAAQMVKENLAECGIELNLEGGKMNTVFAPGQQGPIFGRNFDMAQFGWVTSLEPPCFIYTSAEIPGPYPEYPKGWGGANAVGYSDTDFDRACQKARYSLPDFPEHQAAHYQAQSIFVRDIPVVPLYLGIKQVIMRPDMCGVILDSSSSSALWNLEAFDYGEACSG